jgi:hypothetical protein
VCSIDEVACRLMGTERQAPVARELVAGGNREGGIRHRLQDDDRLAAQGRIFLLFARRKKGVEIEEQPLDGIFDR